MKSRAGLVITAIIATGIYIISSNNKLMLNWHDYRVEVQNAFGSDRQQYGNLYAFSYLPQFKSDDPMLKAHYPDTVRNVKRDVNLYALCDSYLYIFVQKDVIFHGVKRYWFGRPGLDSTKVKLDTTQKNVLMLECTERGLRRLGNPALFMASLQPVYAKNPTDTTPTSFQKPLGMLKFPLKEYFFNPYLPQTLEFNLFDYKFISPIKEFKATVNYNLFNRTNAEVRISPDGKYLFLATTVDSNSVSSSFTRIEDKEINTIVASLNTMYDHFKKLGFDEVYLTIVPSPVSIIAPEMGTYNHLTERVQYNPALKLPFVDLYRRFYGSKEPIYQPADTHWNNYGFKLWVEEFNKKLAAATYKNK